MEETKYSNLLKQCTEHIEASGGFVHTSHLNLEEMPGFVSIYVVSEFDNTRSVTLFLNVQKDTEMSMVLSISEPAIRKIYTYLAA